MTERGQCALRVYDPPECDGAGVPLDWERCRKCEGRGWHPSAPLMSDVVPCRDCDGHGSLKAAALNLLDHGGKIGLRPIRCEDCGHPMSEGTWEGDLRTATITAPPQKAHLTFRIPAGVAVSDEAWAERHAQAGWTWLRAGRDPEPWAHVATHYSPCDEGCRHGGPGRVQHINGKTYEDSVKGPSYWLRHDPYEASWRPVDVRTLGWPHDLRPEKLAVLCLRCFADRQEDRP